VVAARLGTALPDARTSVGLTQAQVAARAALSQTLISDLELGLGTSASIETWGLVAAAVGEQLVGFLEHAPGAGLPRDIEHLRRQSALIQIASAGSWVAMPELAIDRDVVRSRSIDVALVRRASREAVVGEIWNWFDDIGAALRSLDGKLGSARAKLASGDSWTVRGLLVVRDTRRNRELVAELKPLFVARFGSDSALWLEALTDPGRPLPEGDGLLWSDRAGTSLKVSRLRG
jgi:transcriptional regulator with XRE-family HTH domain